MLRKDPEPQQGDRLPDDAAYGGFEMQNVYLIAPSEPVDLQGMNIIQWKTVHLGKLQYRHKQTPKIGQFHGSLAYF